MRYLRATLLAAVSLFFFSGTLQAQSVTDLMQKAKSMGLSESDIQSQLNNAGMGSSLDLSSGESSSNKATLGGATNIYSNTDNLLFSNMDDRDRNLINQLVIEQELHVRMRDSLDKVVFGREIFSIKDLSFEPQYNMATPSGYVIGAGDEIIIDVWGQSEATYKLKVSPDGTVFIKNIGLVSLNGLTIEQAREKMRNTFSKIYEGIEGGDVRVELSLGQMRTISVNVVGEVEMPGTYKLPSLTTLFNALYMAKGTNDIGTLRDIKLYRNNKEVASLDVYDYILNGNSQSNFRLEDNDIIMVGPYQNLVKIGGKIKRSRIYELKKGESLKDLIEYAGGFSGNAYTENIQVNRKTTGRYSIYTVDKNNIPGFVMQDGDSVFIGSAIQRFENRVSVRGAVWREGNYELQRARTLLGLVKLCDGIKGDAFTSRIQIERTRPDFKREIIAVSLEKILAGEAPDVQLQAEDAVYIPSIYDLQESSYIVVKGEVNKAVDLNPTKENKNDYLELYARLYSRADISDIKNDVGYNEILNKIYQNRLNPYLNRDIEHLTFDYSKTDSVPVVKRVLSDTIPFRENMTIADAILLAGGLKESASQANIMVARRIKNPTSTTFANKLAEEFIFNIGKDLSLSKDAANFILEPYDEVIVRRSPGYQEQQIVRIAGEVLFPGDYVLTERGTRLTDLLEKAGNATPEAYIRGAHLKRKMTVEDLVRQETLSKISSDMKAGSSKDTITAGVVPMMMVGIDMEKALEDPESDANIILMEGDVLTIPQKMNTVQIDGAVLYPNIVTYNDSYKVKDYIRQAGNYVDRARKRPYIIYMNGTVASTRNGFFCKRYPKVEPGCEIVVPMKSADKKPVSGMEVVSMLNSSVSMAAMITSILNQFK